MRRSCPPAAVPGPAAPHPRAHPALPPPVPSPATPRAQPCRGVARQLSSVQPRPAELSSAGCEAPDGPGQTDVPWGADCCREGASPLPQSEASGGVSPCPHGGAAHLGGTLQPPVPRRAPAPCGLRARRPFLLSAWALWVVAVGAWRQEGGHSLVCTDRPLRQAEVGFKELY